MKLPKNIKKEKSLTLKSRLRIAFICVILLPLVLTGVVLFVVMNYKVQTLGRDYHVENPTYRSLYNNSLLIARQLESEYDHIQKAIDEDQDAFLDNAALNTLNNELSEKGTFIVVKKEDEIIYNGSTNYSDDDLKQTLPNLYLLNDGDKKYIRMSGDSMIMQYNFTYSDGQEGSIYLVAEMSRVSPTLMIWIIEIFILIIILLTITGGAMYMWVYKGVVNPLNQLKQATHNIKEGNLDFTVSCEGGVKEVNALCDDFDDMRLRLKETARERLLYDKQNKELISNISHDLKTPITAVKGYVEGIMDGVADTPEKMERYMRTIYNKTMEMDRLINELAFYSKIDTNKIPYSFMKVSVSDYFDDCMEELSVELSAQNIELTYCNYLQDDTMVVIDPEQMKRVINNIISNSVKYMNKERKIINIRIRDAGDFIQFEIEDNGKGIAQNDLSKIFDRFYRTDASRNSTRGGSGIGLSIVKKIIDDHGGQVWARSKEGVGTIMYFVLRKHEEVQP